MKMPNAQSSENNVYDYEEYYADHLENNAVEDFNPSHDNDFSEYLWMENEEEFDKEIMQRLEEEALMEECMEAMLADDDASLSQAIEPQENVDGLSDLVDNLSKLNCADLAKESNLNPLAAEFIPGAASSSPSITAAVTTDVTSTTSTTAHSKHSTS